MATGRKAASVFADPPVSEQRSRIMASIRGRDTKPEVFLRKALHRMGLRYRTSVKALPGKPDIVLARHRAVVLVNGCFWHGHDCGRCRIPATRTEYWRNKIKGNKERDERIENELLGEGWRVITVWECRIGAGKGGDLDACAARVAKFILGKRRKAEIG